MEERVRRLERWNKGMLVLLLVFFWLSLWFRGPKISDIVVGKQVTTTGIAVMDQLGPRQKPRVQLFPGLTDTLLSFISSNNTALLSIGIAKDPKQGDIPMIIFETKAGQQVLKPNEQGKMTWTDGPLLPQ